jgi:two-component system response regulator FixJ
VSARAQTQGLVIMTDQIVSVIDGDAAVREAIAELVAPMGLEALKYELAEEFLSSYDRTQGGCLVLADRLRGMSALELLTAMPSEGIHVSTIVLSTFGDVRMAMQTMQAGAIGVLQKPYREHELWDAIRQGLQTDAEMRQAISHLADVRARLTSLTSDERRVLQLVLVGATSKEISRQLSMPLRTVESRRHSLMVKLKADSLAELIRLVVESQTLAGTSNTNSGLPSHCLAAQKLRR